MARKPDLPCSDCGELMWRGSTSLPEGQATCLPCRRAKIVAVDPIETWVCNSCGVTCSRLRVRGQKPRWCAECRAQSVWQHTAIVCAECGKSVTGLGKTYCSMACSNRNKPGRPKKPRPARIPKPRPDLRSELRRGYEDGDAEMFFSALVSQADTQGECWIWPRLDSKGYARVHWTNVGLYRMTLEIKYGQSLGSQHAHHMCANAACVNPDHLQPVTHRDNIAEMMARQSYLARIRELEQALAGYDATHPLLKVIAVA